MSERRRRMAWPIIAAALCAVPVIAGIAVGQVRSGVVIGRPAALGPRSEGTGRIRGRVVDATARRPLRGATILASWRALAGDGQAQFSTRTDGDGVFAIESLADGMYFLNVQRQGFFEAPVPNGAQRQVTLRDGSAVDVGDVRLLRGGVLTGRVFDDQGEPVVRAMVSPIGRLSSQGSLTMLGGVSMTDDRGVYRVHGLRPGKYTVRAAPQGPSSRGPVRLQGDVPELLPAFASSATDPAAAEFVDVRAGEDAMLDVRLPVGRVTMVAGQAVVADEATAPVRAQMALRPIERDADLRIAGASSQPDGRFEFRDVAPGRYLVVAEEPPVSTPQGPARRRVGWAEIAVSGEPVTDVVVPMGFGAIVRGRIEAEGGDLAVLASRPLQVVARAPFPGPLPSSLSMHASSTPDLAFELRDVAGFRQLQLAGLPEGWWLKSVLVDGEDVFDGRDFPTTGVVDGVVILVSAHPSGITGRVEAGAGDLQGSTVLVLPGGRVDTRDGPAGNRRIASVSGTGTFTAAGLRPGGYTVVALSPRARSAYERLDAEQRQELVAAHGRPVDVVEGRLAAVTLRLVER